MVELSQWPHNHIPSDTDSNPHHTLLKGFWIVPFILKQHYCSQYLSIWSHSFPMWFAVYKGGVVALGRWPSGRGPGLGIGTPGTGLRLEQSLTLPRFLISSSCCSTSMEAVEFAVSKELLQIRDGTDRNIQKRNPRGLRDAKTFCF